MRIDHVLELHPPKEVTAPLVFDSPHSGQDYPPDFDYACDFADLVGTEDRFVDELFSDAPQYGAPLLRALFPRCYIDVNRAVDDIDPALFEHPWPLSEFGAINPTNRSDAGIGLIRRLITPKKTVYNSFLTPKTILNRINTYYTPYHDQLSVLIDQNMNRFGKNLHINCHSMPSNSANRAKLLRFNPSKSVDFCLGDRNGTTCDPAITTNTKEHLESLGYNVTINDPYRGVELVQKYSNPEQGRHSLQVEINRALYMDEQSFEKTKNFEKLKTDINKTIEFWKRLT